MSSPLNVRNIDPLEGRSIVASTFEVEITPGGEKVVLNGTVEEVHAQLLELNANWDEDFPVVDDLDSSGLEKRTDFRGANVLCHDRWGYANGRRIHQGIQ